MRGLVILGVAVIGAIIYCAKKSKQDEVTGSGVSTAHPITVDTTTHSQIAVPVSAIRRSPVGAPVPQAPAHNAIRFSSVATAAPNRAMSSALIPQTARFQRLS